MTVRIPFVCGCVCTVCRHSSLLLQAPSKPGRRGPIGRRVMSHAVRQPSHARAHVKGATVAVPAARQRARLAALVREFGSQAEVSRAYRHRPNLPCIMTATCSPFLHAAIRLHGRRMTLAPPPGLCRIAPGVVGVVGLDGVHDCLRRDDRYADADVRWVSWRVRWERHGARALPRRSVRSRWTMPDTLSPCTAVGRGGAPVYPDLRLTLTRTFTCPRRCREEPDGLERVDGMRQHMRRGHADPPANLRGLCWDGVRRRRAGRRKDMP